jgi:hypothetical protein
VSARQRQEPTERQAEYLDFIRHYSGVHKRPPSEGDMARYFGVSAPSVHQMILTLEARGFLARDPGKARATQVLVPPPRRTPRGSSPSAVQPAMLPAGEPTSVVEAATSVGREVLSRLFAHADQSPLDDAEFAPLVGCVLDGVDAGLRAAGATRDVAGEARNRLLEEALRKYCAPKTILPALTRRRMGRRSCIS